MKKSTGSRQLHVYINLKRSLDPLYSKTSAFSPKYGEYIYCIRSRSLSPTWFSTNQTKILNDFGLHLTTMEVKYSLKCLYVVVVATLLGEIDIFFGGDAARVL
uniref:Uncharacterized protein n=1 Tax=Glossina brevipalpis TaxID=37001 RepID=A0A1A9WZT4_9MUSC